MEIYINYIFAFLHGVVHPLVLLPFVKHKLPFLGVAAAAGCITLFEYWFLGDVLHWRFMYNKGILAVTTAIIGFGWVLGFKTIPMLTALLTGLCLAAFSHIMLGKSITPETWAMLFPVLVAGQLVIYFGGFITARKIVLNKTQPE